ncbi:MAG TPA: hypothetical protein VID25_01010 [Candidatus Limnocylindrales bacterium]
MLTWRCPHCGTRQAEAARCWVCTRSSTTCATCLHFRRGVTDVGGTCGLDRRKGPLRGDEIQPCWKDPMAVGAAPVGLFEAGWPLPELAGVKRATS